MCNQIAYILYIQYHIYDIIYGSNVKLKQKHNVYNYIYHKYNILLIHILIRNKEDMKFY